MGLEYRKPPRWQVPVVGAVVVVVLAAGGLFVALRTAAGQAEDEVAAGPASRQESRQDARPAQRSTAKTTPSQATSPKTTAQPKPKPKAKANPPALNSAKQGPTAVLSGVAEPGAAAKLARKLKRRGFRVGTVANAPSPAERSAVLYAPGSMAAGRALAKQLGIGAVKRVDSNTAGSARGAKLYVIVGARR